MRQLAAILFADMTGYTALVQENELLARQKRKRLKEVLERSATEYQGRILQYYGDGSLTIFNSAIQAVDCAIALQHQLQLDPKVDVRIGIHTGDINIEDESIYGDGVNLASRIESLASPGAIFISEKVYDDIKNHQHISSREMGYFELKNVKQPVKIHAIANRGIVVPDRHEVKGNTSQPHNRLAVLPFVNMSNDPENEYFSDGITEELLNALTKVEELQVTSRTSAFAFKGKNEDIRDIALKLNVDKVLEGSVRKVGNRVRITAQLINAADGYHIWSENYDRNLDDIFEVQDEISGIIANKLRENLTVKEQKKNLVSPHTKNVVAYTWYLKGLHYKNKQTPADTRKAISCFEEAITLEPDYSHAYAMIALGYGKLASSGQMHSDKARQIVLKYAEKALELNNSIAESHIAKAMIYLEFDWDWKNGFRELQVAKSLNPAATGIYDLLSYYYIAHGEAEKAVQVMEEAQSLDPLSTTMNMGLGNMYIFAERWDDAQAQADKLLEMDPKMRAALELKAWAIGCRGDWNAALELFKEFHRLTNHPLKGLMGLGHAYGRLGERALAEECIEKIKQRQVQEPDLILDADLAGIYLALQDYDQVYYYANQCIDKRMGHASYIFEYPPFKNIKNEPRFARLRERMGLD